MELNLDDNNNSTDNKGYSLRPRSAPKTAEVEDALEDVPRSRGRTQRSSKQKSLPLSKYRRKTANARERSRMREINEAFENLRKSIPLISTKCDNPSEKNTKISTLRLAMKYITVLSNALRDSDGESDKESIFSEYSLTPPDCRDAYTPTSTSDNSDLSDTFFSTNLLSRESSTHCVSPFSSSSSFNFHNNITEKRPSVLTSLDKKSSSGSNLAVFNSDSEKNKKNNILQSVSLNLPTAPTSLPPSYSISRVQPLENPSLVDSSSLFTSHFTSGEDDLKMTSLMPITVQLQSNPFLDEWDDLSFSRVDLDEFLIS